MKNLFTFFAAVVLTANVFAQAPQKMSYQAVIRNSSNALVTSTAVGMRISILQTSASGTAVYVETQTPTTNANGLVSLEIGAGTAVTGTFAGINWSAGPYFIKTETDPAGGTSYSITGTSQLLSVPYALSAAGIANPTGLVIPKLTTAQITALPVSPAPFGTLVFDTTTNTFKGYRTVTMPFSTTYGNSGSASPLTLGASESIKQTFNLTSSATNATLTIQSMSGGIFSTGNLILKVYSGAFGSETLQSTTTLPVNSAQNLYSFNFSNLSIPSGNGYFILETDSTASVRVMTVSAANINNSPQQGYLNGQVLPALTGTNFNFSISWSGYNTSTGWFAFQ